MIIESICKLGCSILAGVFSAFEMISLPFNLINTLSSILQYGTWVVGSDVLLLFTGSVVFWWGVKASIGIGIWAYEHIPFIS